MARQSAIGLSDAQKTYLRAEALKAQTRFTELLWQLQDAMEGLTGLLKQSKVDEVQVLAQLDKVLASEREIKKAQISLLVRMKNNLTPEQQHDLLMFRNESKPK
jgi:Spy/CpxP family protein refolding chaperone